MIHGNINDSVADQSNDFDCAICTGSFNYHSITVVQLPCEHQLCYKCYHALESTMCPYCRKPFEFEIHPPKNVTDGWERNLQKWIKDAVEEYMEMNQTLQTFQMQQEYWNVPTVVEFALTPAMPRGRSRSGSGRTRQGRRRRRAVPVPVSPEPMEFEL